MKLKKLASLLLAVLMLLSSMGAIALAEEPVTLTICSADNTFGLSTDPDLQQAVIKLLEEKCNVKLNAVIPPIGSYNDKLETMMAGGDVPDVFSISQAMTRLPNYVAREQVMDLTDLIAASEALKIVDPSYYQALEIGGKVYAMPYYYPRVKVLLNEPGLFIPLFQGENRGKFCGLLQSREAGKGAAASSGNQYENL